MKDKHFIVVKDLRGFLGLEKGVVLSQHPTEEDTLLSGAARYCKRSLLKDVIVKACEVNLVDG